MRLKSYKKAPKDGTSILVKVQDSDTKISFRICEYKNIHSKYPTLGGNFEYDSVLGIFCVPEKYFIGWMHIPDNPIH